MANHKSALKRVRQDERKRLHNRYYKKTTRTMIQRLRDLEDKNDAQKFLPKVVSAIDGMVKRNLYHRNKASNLKSSLTKFVNGL